MGSVMACVEGFCGDVVRADAFVDNDDTAELLQRQQEKLARDGFLPADMNECYNFDVYWLQGRFARHASIVFTSNGEHCVTAELQWYTGTGTHTCLPWANGFKMSEHRHRRMERRGTVWRSARQIIKAGIRAMKRFGEYGKLTNNCQDYCNLVLDELGLQQRLTDTDRVLLATTVLAPFVYLGMKFREALY